jgi:phospholipid/cholesterol/gamma-HCH transport system substrate-binding protein
VDLTYKQEVGVGALVLVGVGIFVGGMLWLSGRSVSGEGASVDVMFTNVAGLKQGDPVLVSGVKKGRVARVALERVGSVRVTLQLGSDVRPKLDASAVVASVDFFGAKFIDYSPGTRDEFLPDDRAIVGENPPGLTDVASGVATRANELLSNASSLVSEQLVLDIHNTMIATQRAMNALSEAGDGPLIKQTTRTLQAAEHVMTRVDSILASGTGQRIDTLSRNLATLTNHLGSATVAIDTMLRRMNRGEGSLGKLASDSTLYHDLHALSVALTALMTDLKEHPDKYMKPGLIRVRMF